MNENNSEIIINKEPNNFLFDKFSSEIQQKFGGVLIEKMHDGLETKYFDFNINGNFLTLHQIPFVGITIFPSNKNKIKKSEFQLTKEIADYLKQNAEDFLFGKLVEESKTKERVSKRIIMKILNKKC